MKINDTIRPRVSKLIASRNNNKNNLKLDPELE